MMNMDEVLAFREFLFQSNGRHSYILAKSREALGLSFINCVSRMLILPISVKMK